MKVVPRSTAEMAADEAQAAQGGTRGRVDYEEAVFKSFANPTELWHLVDGLELFVRHGIFTGHALSHTPTEQPKTVAVVSFYKQQVTRSRLPPRKHVYKF